MFRNYVVDDMAGDRQWLTTFTSGDNRERIVAGKTAYCSVHGASAAIGAEWEYAVEGEDEYSPTVAQIWVATLEGQGEVFDPANYAAVAHA